MDWKTLEAAVDAAVIRAFGEDVRHSPMTPSGTADPSRPVQVIRGVLHTPAAAGAISLGPGMVTTLAASEGALVVERAAYPMIVFRGGDRIRGLDLPGQPLWEVKTVNDRFSSVWVLVLSQV